MNLRPLVIAIALLVPGFTAEPRNAAGTAQECRTGHFARDLCALHQGACSGIPTLDRLGNYTIERALCECDVLKGVSMGPGACQDRAPVTQQGRTYLISTYSNHDNDKNRTLSCQNPQTIWAVLRAPCVVDQNNPDKATCTCPLMQSPASTLAAIAGRMPARIWSVAVRAGDAFASEHFYRTVQRQFPSLRVNPPAPACPAR